MSYKIVVDSCCDLPVELRKNPNFEVVPLTIEIDDERIVDDETFNQALLLEKMKKSPNAPKTSCPSPEDYMRAYETEVQDVYVITLSDKLSGSYNSAVLGKNIYHEERGDKNIAVLNSFSACAAEALIATRLHELAEEGRSFQDIVKTMEGFIKEMKTMFVLETLDNLKKNGRLNNLQALIANVLNIKPIMGATEEGTICKLDQARGIKKALNRMAEIVEAEGKNLQDKVLAIAHCNCYERAVEFKNEILKRCKFKDIFIVETAGISTVYANDGGIVIAY